MERIDDLFPIYTLTRALSVNNATILRGDDGMYLVVPW